MGDSGARTELPPRTWLAIGQAHEEPLVEQCPARPPGEVLVAAVAEHVAELAVGLAGVVEPGEADAALDWVALVLALAAAVVAGAAVVLAVEPVASAAQALVPHRPALLSFPPRLLVLSHRGDSCTLQ